MARLKGKVAVVTGASKGIGAEIAKHLAREGASVVVNYATSKQGADEVVSAITHAGGTAIALSARVDDELAVAAMFEQVRATFGRVDILVNNAGVYAFAPLAGITTDHFHQHFNTNVLGLLLVSKAAVPFFPASGGSIVNVSSVVASLAPAYASVYSASKGAVNTITKSLAKELASSNIRVNAVCPGYVETEGTASYAGSDFERMAVSGTPLGRAGRPSDIAPPVAFFASDDAAWVTGETLYVSGGAAI